MPKTRLHVGLTGGIGSGKSEALKSFARAGACAISADEIAHEIFQKGSSVYRRVVRAFGPGILHADGRIDRKILGARVFARPALRRRLEALTHPPIRREMRRRMRGARKPVVVVDVPLLFESGKNGLAKEFDVTVLVSASREQRIARVRRRDRMSRNAVMRRMRAQMPESEKKKLADIVLLNDGNLKTLRRCVREYQNALHLIAGGKR